MNIKTSFLVDHGRLYATIMGLDDAGQKVLGAKKVDITDDPSKENVTFQEQLYVYQHDAQMAQETEVPQKESDLKAALAALDTFSSPHPVDAWVPPPGEPFTP